MLFQIHMLVFAYRFDQILNEQRLDAFFIIDDPPAKRLVIQPFREQ